MAIKDKQKLITEIISIILNEPAQTDKKFEWFINKHLKENFKHKFPVIENIFKNLNGDLIANQAKRKVYLECDAFFNSQYNFIFEFDEMQHFSSKRLETFNFYQNDIKLNFDKKEWVYLCEKYGPKANEYRKNKTTTDFNFVGGRTAQRAYLDCFRDLLPEIHGLNPTLRINEFEVSTISRADKDACITIEKLIKTKLIYV